MSLVVIAAFFFLRFFLPPVQVSMILGLFTVLLPTTQIANFLMVRHYVEGLLFALLALICFCKWSNQRNKSMLVLGSTFYFIAALAKEIYVPLPALLLVLPVGSMANRIRASVPYFLVAALYAVIRIYMLGNEVVVGYSGQFASWSAIQQLPANLADKMGWHFRWQIPVLISILVGLSLSMQVQLLNRLGTGLAVLILIFLPLTPVLGRLELFAYYLFVFGFVFSIAAVVGIVHLTGTRFFYRLHKPLSLMLFLVAILTFVIPSLLEHANLNQIASQKRIQEEYLLSHAEPGSVVIYNNYIADDLVHFRQKRNSELGELKWCPVSDCLCAQHYGRNSSVQFNGEQWIDVGTVPQNCVGPTPSADLSVEFVISLPDTLTWSFGPYSAVEGNYYIASTMDEFSEHLDVPKVMPVPPQGQFKFCCSPFAEPFSWTVAFKSVEGWEIVSDPVFIATSAEGNNGVERISWSAND